MAGAVGGPTKTQSRKVKDAMSRHGTAGRRRTSKDVLAQLDEENVDVVGSSHYSRRSFPLDHESDSWSRDNKKAVKTESSAKQRRTLVERGENCSKRHVVLIKKQEQTQQSEPQEQTRPMTRAAAKAEQHRREQRISCDGQFQIGLLMDTTDPLPDAECATSILSMDTELTCTSDASTNERPPIPEGVPDIDANPDSLTTTVYSKDIMDYLQIMEPRALLKPGFLDNSPDVTSRMRGVLMDWLLQVENHEELRQETLHLCVNMIDKFLAQVNVKMPKLQLVGITCLLIASKFNERFAPEISTLCYLTDNTFERDQVLHYERYVLHTLQFDLVYPVSTTFLDRYLQVHEQPAEVKKLARYLLDLTITSVHMVSILPSIKAASALFLARRLLLDNTPSWTPRLEFYTNYTAGQINEVANEMATLLIKAPDSKFQGARNKYNSEEHFNISTCDRVGPGWVLIRQFS